MLSPHALIGFYWKLATGCLPVQALFKRALAMGQSPETPKVLVSLWARNDEDPNSAPEYWTATRLHALMGQIDNAARALHHDYSKLCEDIATDVPETTLPSAGDSMLLIAQHERVCQGGAVSRMQALLGAVDCVE